MRRAGFIVGCLVLAGCTLVSGVDQFTFGGAGGQGGGTGGSSGGAGGAGGAGMGGGGSTTGGAGSGPGGTGGGGDGGMGGCMADTQTDVLNCGACGRVCSGSGVHTKICEGGVCKPICILGLLDLSHPAAPVPDNGCEDSSDEGSCGSEGVACLPNIACNDSGVPVTCSAPPACGTLMVNCGLGEECTGALGACKCNGGAECGPGVVCCPSGCKTLAGDPANCGACGRTCAPGMACVANDCQCDSNGDCDGGTTGTCSAGKCVCGGTSCATGERCLSDASCG